MIDAIIKWFPIIFGCGILVAFGGVIFSGIRQHMRERGIREFRRTLQSEAPHIVTATIMENILPMERGQKYAKPLDAALITRGKGIVTGGGTQMTRDGSIAYVDIEIALTDLEGALAFARDFMRQSGAPKGSTLSYLDGNKRIKIPIE